MTEVYLVRHGQATFGSDHYDRLSETGRLQAALLGRHLAERGLRFDGVMLGTLQRHRETLQAMGAPFSDGMPVTGTTDLDEYELRDIIRSWRELTGREDRGSESIEAFYRVAQSALRAWSSGELPQAPLSWPTFRARSRAVMETIADSSAERMLVITSGGPISAHLQDLLNLTPEVMVALNLELANTGVTRLIIEQRTRRLISFNSVAHLESGEHQSLISRL